MAPQSRKIFVNLPVKNLNTSMAFFKALGFGFNAQFTDETSASMVICDNIYATLVTHGKFKEFSNKPIADATRTTEVVTCLSAESREEVNKLADSALEAGGQKLLEPQDLGFMYLRSFQDPDGHIWEIMWMDSASVKQTDTAKRRNAMSDMERVMQGVIPYLMVDGADAAIAFYQKAFGAKDLGTMRSEDGKHVMHSQLEINGGALMLSDAAVMGEKQNASQSYMMQLVTREGDRWWKRAVDAGCTVEVPFEMQFWGDRWGKLRDPMGITWALLEPGPENAKKEK